MRLLSLVAYVWLGILAALASDAGVGIIGFFLFLYGGLAIAVWWLVLRLRAFGARKRDPDVVSPSWRRWVIVPAVLVGGAAVNMVEGANNPLFIARFRLSEAALTREATRMLQTPDSADEGERRVGLFVVQRSTVVADQVRFITASCGVIDSCGIVYAPTAAPKRWQEDSFSPLRGRWWHLHERF